MDTVTVLGQVLQIFENLGIASQLAIRPDLETEELMKMVIAGILSRERGGDEVILNDVPGSGQ